MGISKMQYLAHHGIKGQKWGERNGPPYPLSAGAHSAAEKKAAGDSGASSSKKKKKKQISVVRQESPNTLPLWP